MRDHVVTMRVRDQLVLKGDIIQREEVEDERGGSELSGGGGNGEWILRRKTKSSFYERDSTQVLVVSNNYQ